MIGTWPSTSPHYQDLEWLPHPITHGRIVG